MANVHARFPDEQPSTIAAAAAATQAAAAGPAISGSMAVNQQFNNITPLSNNNKNNNKNNNNNNNNIEYNGFEELPCEKYRQFMDSSIEERTFMIEKLVETFANVIDSIWHPKFLIEHQQVKVMPTRGFCNEILKRSKATYSTLQISLFYIFRVKKVVHEKLYQRIKQQQKELNLQTSNDNDKMDDLMCCGRRMFLASLMVASKYLHDKNYHNKAWSKITGLGIKEINAAEMAFLQLIDYKLYVSKPTFDKWYTQLHGHIQKNFNKSTATTAVKPLHLTTFSLQQQQQQQQQQQYRLSAPVSTTTTTITFSNYPSPPIDNNNLAPLSPPMTTSDCSPSSQSSSSSTSSTSSSSSTEYQRADSGVSFDIYSPFSVGTKRQWESTQKDDEISIIDSNNTKRICQ